MNKLSKKMEQQGARIYVACLLVFAVVTIFACEHYWLAVAEAAAAVVLLLISRAISRARQRELVKYIESVAYEAEAAKNNTMMNFPLPMVTYQLQSGRVVWGNQEFFTACGQKEPTLNAFMEELVPGYGSQWMLEGKRRCPNLVEVNGRKYQVRGNVLRGNGEQEAAGALGITYWVDVTDYDELRREYAASRPVIMLIMIDNFDEMVRNAPERAAGELRNQVEDKFAQWTEGKRGFLRRYDRERYIFMCERRYFDQLAKENFSVIDSVHEITNTSAIHATVSIGIGLDGVSMEENFNYASMSLDMALSRGGDQVVVRNRMNFEFYGGRAAEVETRTKVRSRVVANALRSSVQDAGTTFVMGHRFADTDCLGAAVGICCIARKYGKRARIVMDEGPNACGRLLEMLKKQKEYADVFVTPQEAMLQANSRSLLVVVDTARPEQVADPALLQTIGRLVLIDHHRRGASYIENAALSLYEPYASSACELVTELLQELVGQEDILRYEAEVMLAGIVTDTKSFSLRTGERTFDAAAYLRRAGADTASVKRLLQNDFDSTVTRYSILDRSRIYRDNVCLAVMDAPVARVVAAQAADEMLNISGVEASVVLYPEADGVILSARSIGSLNVQVLMEKLGGGGNQSAAAAQIPGVTIEEATARLETAIDEYLS